MGRHQAGFSPGSLLLSCLIVQLGCSRYQTLWELPLKARGGGRGLGLNIAGELSEQSG